MLLFVIGLLWFFAWGALIYVLETSSSDGSRVNWRQAGMSWGPGKNSEYHCISSNRPLGSLPTGPDPIPISFEPSEANKPKFYAACSEAGTLRTFETSDELLCFIAGKPLSSWAVFKRRYARKWSVWRRVDLSGHMSSSEAQEVIWKA